MTSLSDPCITYCPLLGYGTVIREGDDARFTAADGSGFMLSGSDIGCYVDRHTSEVWVIFFVFDVQEWVPFLADPPGYEVSPPAKLRELLDERNRRAER